MTGSHAYPRPQLERDEWTSLNGDWEFAIDREARWTLPAQVDWDSHIEVPFSPETPASGVGDTGFYNAVWYRRTFDAPGLAEGRHLLLHFGAVDYCATVWVNGRLAVTHEGGYTPFCVDITEFLVHPRPADDRRARRGRSRRPLQAARQAGLAARSRTRIWYPRTTGIWQTVWLEAVLAELDRRRALDPQRRALGDRLRSLAARRAPGRPAPRRQAARRRPAARRRHLRR